MKANGLDAPVAPKTMETRYGSRRQQLIAYPPCRCADGKRLLRISRTKVPTFRLCRLDGRSVRLPRSKWRLTNENRCTERDFCG